MLEEQIKKLAITSENYPELLQKIDKPPKELYVKGQLLRNEPLFAIVGTRAASSYGKETAFWLSKELSQAGLTIVSGMARGIDTFAHRGALEGGGKTIAVLATGLDNKIIYPQENLNLSRQIIEKGGCLISEYPPRYPGARHNFLQRNRLISGISLGVLVIEAKLKSGALNTASWAKKQSRKVFALPGHIQSLNSQGCHLLIKQGALLVEKPGDILKALKLSPSPLSSISSKKASSLQSKNPSEALILNALSGGALSIDKIIEKTQLAASQTASCLSLLEIENKVKNLGGNTYALV